MAIGKVFKIFSIVILAIVLLASCGVPDPQEIADSLLIYYPSDSIFQRENQVMVGWGLEARVVNRSDYCVFFPYDYGIKIYLKAGEIETEIENTVTYLNPEDVRLVEKNNVGSQGAIVLRPDLTNIVIDAPQEFRATITGHLCDDETVEITKEIIFFVVP